MEDRSSRLLAHMLYSYVVNNIDWRFPPLYSRGGAVAAEVFDLYCPNCPLKDNLSEILSQDIGFLINASDMFDLQMMLCTDRLFPCVESHAEVPGAGHSIRVSLRA